MLVNYIGKKVNLKKRTITDFIKGLKKEKYIRVETINYKRYIYLLSSILLLNK